MTDKTEYLQLRITPEDKQMIKEGADRHKMNMTDYILMLVYRDRQIKRVDKIATELIKIINDNVV